MWLVMQPRIRSAFWVFIRTLESSGKQGAEEMLTAVSVPLRCSEVVRSWSAYVVWDSVDFQKLVGL